MKEILYSVPGDQEILCTDADLASFEHIANASTLDELGREVRKISYQLGLSTICTVRMCHYPTVSDFNTFSAAIRTIGRGLTAGSQLHSN